MSPPQVRGWCPSLHRPMAARDGLLSRVKPYAGALTADGLRILADAAERHGSGRIDLTGRAAFQVRGLDEAGAPRFAAAMVEAALASADPASEARRNVQLDPRAAARMQDWARSLEAWLETAHELDPLPSKFGFALSTDGGLDSDIHIVGEDRPMVHVSGAEVAAGGRHPVAAAQDLARAFLQLAPGLSPPPRRMKALVERVGAASLFAAAGLATEPRPAFAPVRRRVGWESGGFILGVALGAADTSLLRTAADLADRFGDGRLALTSDRGLWLAGVSAADAADLETAASGSGFIVSPDDPRSRLQACVGAAGCVRTGADTRADALELAAFAPAGGLHVSGCAKGCAHPGVTAVTLVGAQSAYGYHLLRDAAPGAYCPGASLSLSQIADTLRP